MTSSDDTHDRRSESRALTAAANWRLDIKGAEVRANLAAAGVPCVLLKGRAFAELFYGDGAPRPYCDCDLLVAPTLSGAASAVLSGLGFDAMDRAPHSRAWCRETDGVWVDLHHSLPQLEADPADVWAILWRRATSIIVGGSPTRVLDPAASGLLASLHLAHHGADAAGPREDLARAIDQLAGDCWDDAANLARELGAAAAMGTGLRLLPTGIAIAERLDLPWAPSAYVLLNWGAPWEATVWEALASTHSARARASLLARFLAPTPDFLRQRSALARRGPRGMALAYAVRPFLLAARAGWSFGPWRRARRPPG